MKNKRSKNKRIIAGLIGFILIGILLFFAESLVGNPISKIVVNNSARKYAKETYKDLNLTLDDSYYDFKLSQYVVRADSENSVDTHFDIKFNAAGKVVEDDYRDKVLSKWNTWERINEDYGDMVDIVLNDDLPYKKILAFGQLVDISLNLDDLEVDKIYDIKEIAKTDGLVTLHIESENLDKKTMVEALLKVKELFDLKDVPFYSISLDLERPSEEDPDLYEESIGVEGFLYKDIAKADLDKRVEEAIERRKELHEEENKVKQEEIDEFEDEKDK